MALKKSYSRYFIILQEDEKGYSLSSDKLASGYAKLEMKNDKCKISYYVQNLKKELAPYYMMLICNKKEVKKIIKIGEMNIDDYGRADICYEYPVDNIANTNVAMDKISGAAVVKLLNNNIISVMSGFASTDIPEWKSFVIIEDKSRNTVEDDKKETTEKSIFDKYEESIEVAKAEEQIENLDKVETDRQQESVETTSQEKTYVIPEKTNVDENIDESAEEKVEETPKEKVEINVDKETERKVEENVESDKENKVEDKTAFKIEDKVECRIEEKEEITIKPIVDEIKENNTSKNVYNAINENYYNESLNNESTDNKSIDDKLKEYPRGTTGDFFKSIIKGFKETSIVCPEIKRCKWYEIPVNCIEEMYDISNYNRYTIIYYPMISYYSYIRNFGHFLIGYKCDKDGKIKYIVYAIPGTKDRIYQPYGGRSGFVTWIPAKEDYKEVSGFGYWLMFYDFKTSTVVIPTKK